LLIYQNRLPTEGYQIRGNVKETEKNTITFSGQAIDDNTVLFLPYITRQEAGLDL
jgi:hypothetical protein